MRAPHRIIGTVGHHGVDLVGDVRRGTHPLGQDQVAAARIVLVSQDFAHLEVLGVVSTIGRKCGLSWATQPVISTLLSRGSEGHTADGWG